MRLVRYRARALLCRIQPRQNWIGGATFVLANNSLCRNSGSGSSYHFHSHPGFHLPNHFMQCRAYHNLRDCGVARSLPTMGLNAIGSLGPRITTSENTDPTAWHATKRSSFSDPNGLKTTRTSWSFIGGESPPATQSSRTAS